MYNEGKEIPMAHTSQAALTKKFDQAKRQIKIGDVYAHYKKPEANYIVIDIALIEETEEPAVIYRADYSANLTWIRPLANFLEIIEVDGRKQPRFTKKS